MRRRLFLALAFFSLWGASGFGQNVTRLYPREQLKADAARFGEQITAEYRETILPQLSATEKSALAEIKLEFPIAGPKGDPFEFYTDGKTIYLPALSLRFFSDLCVANAWLNAHGFDGTTVRDYVGLLFREASVSPSAPLPPVFRTLGVPANAREEDAVSERASRNFANAVVFLLAHELGHIAKNHRIETRTPAESRTQEIEADAFALEIMRRIAQVPLGLEFWFDVERIRHAAPLKFPKDEEWQKYLGGLPHPVTTERLNALADAIDKAPDSFARRQSNQALWTMRAGMFAQMFRLSAPFAGNAVARMAEYSRVRELRLAALKPRKAAYTVPGSGAAEEEFEGFFAVRRAFEKEDRSDAIDLLLLRNGNEVNGSYANAAAQGTLEGKIADGVLHFRWQEGSAEGSGRMEGEGDKLRATWGEGALEKGAGTWEGARATRE